MDKKVYNLVYARAKGRCEICGAYGRNELHHIFGRIPEESELNCILLCAEHHRGNTGVHSNSQLDLKIKKMAQKKYIDKGYSEEYFKKISGGRLYDRWGAVD